MSKIRVLFLGTPDFAATCLQGLLADSHYEVVGVVTQPDRPAGRKMQLQPSAVKNYCMAHGLRVISPESVNNELILQQLEVWAAEVAVVVAFGQLLSEKFLELFPLGAVNIHGSLLPRWRGAAPIQRAIEAGDKETGVVLQKVVKKLDAGAVLGIRKMEINDDTDAQQLFREMAEKSVELLQVELMDYVRGNLVGEIQDETKVTYAKKIEKLEGEIQWTHTAEQISRKVRAFITGPGTWTFHDKKKIKVHKVKVADSRMSSGQLPGTVVQVESGSILVQTGEGVLELVELQLESRNRVSAAEFLKGYPLKIRDHLGGGPHE